MIIDVRHQRSLPARLLDLLLTALAWAAFITIFLRGADALFDGSHQGPRPWLPEALRTLGTLTVYLIIAAVNAAILLGWAFYNQWRFRGRDRRRAAPSLSDAQMAPPFAVPAGLLGRMRAGRRLVIHHDAAGTITAVDDRPALKVVPLERETTSFQ
ncbi:poly-beta-1,6-N-acetyl-D-glucosamine biosynthesis protein PgaD [Inquilinus sp. Marseille-Q2685]|uniref:poly-beta-1,6-N-acetyl-D-glucosamine biosynthesis protein PgaD n=1 Tax=Inquilinus sp. Marseille-Q2685 TaxID=2866581 RepID=UPI001CE4816E|nr:poly-beta-1,6-N-acetyl-D-glucosamine biosynthesis protein PgaD [Inquilinus sp. Marseille-Q2685]